MAIAGAEAEMVRRVIAKMVGGERLAALGARAVGKIFRPYGMTGHSIKRGALADAAAAAVEHDLDPRILKQLGNARALGLARNAARCPGHLVAILNSSAKFAALMWRARGAWPNCLVRPQRPGAR
ncbi:hypothetical protein TRVL_10327 [Trypanosoma vivax]|nr:hypothetical protein TRVL_10327 [Trypanosoma vivax]